MGMAAPENVETLGRWADLIVVGRPIGSQNWPDGPYVGFGPETLVSLEISEILKGTPTLQGPNVLALEVQDLRASGAGDAGRPGTVADIDHLLFLNVLDADNRVYYLTAGYMSIFAKVEGQVVTPEYSTIKRTYHDGIFTTALDGRSFEKLIDQVRTDNSADQSPELARLRAHGPIVRSGYFAC